MAKKTTLLEEVIINSIYLVRGQKVMIDRDLAALYGVTTGNLNKAVKRNLNRFPADFMFSLTEEEFKNLIFQNGTSKWGGTRKLPNAFTEQGVAMLSSVLNSDSAVEVNIFIIRIFTRLREMMLTHKDILLKLEQMEKKVSQHDESIQLIFSALKKLFQEPVAPRKRIGFKIKDEE